MAHQLTLDVRLSDAACFENFVAVGNQELVETLQSLTRDAREKEMSAVYCAPPDVVEPVASLADLATHQIICIDDAHTMIGDAQGENLLFNLYEALREQDATLALAAAQPLDGLSFKLADLKSRLQAGLVYRVNPLNDEMKAQAVRLRAQNRGFKMSDEVVQYVLQRYPRDMSSLFKLLDRIDVLSLERQRRVTIPFLRELDRQG